MQTFLHTGTGGLPSLKTLRALDLVMSGQLFISSGDRDFLRILTEWSEKEGFTVVSPSPDLDGFQAIQDSDFVVVSILEYSSSNDFMAHAGYAVAVNKPLVVVLGSDTDEFPPILRSAFAVAVFEDFKSLLPLLKPLCGLSLLSEKVAIDIATIQSRFGVPQ